MRAVLADELGGPECYSLRDVPAPEPKAGEVQIAVHAAGMGYVDALVAAGRYQVKPPVPFCPGMELAGTISALGDGVRAFSVGDAVVASGFGGALADYAVRPAAAVHAMPPELSFTMAAGFLTNYLTAWHGLLDRGGLRAGETVLVLGAAGGTGIAAIQVARLAGARVLAGASTPEKRAYAQEYGAHDVLDYTEAEWRKTLKAMTDGRGVDVVFDPVGGDLLEPAFRSLAWRGRHLVIGFAGGPIPALPVNLALLKGAALIGVDLRQFANVFEPAAAQLGREHLFAAVQRGDLSPPVGARFPLEAFADAMRLAASREGFGKTVVTVRSD